MSTFCAGFHSCAVAKPATSASAAAVMILMPFLLVVCAHPNKKSRESGRCYSSSFILHPSSFILMSSYRPAIGTPLSDVDTPSLILELDAFERNLDKMDASLADKKIKLRPHAKSHKCPEIALRQIKRGAVGVCCQKVSEAAAMVEGGVPDVLIANEVVGAAKLKALAALAKRAKVAVCADDAGNVAALDEAARAAGVKLDVLVEVNVGANRCGVGPGEPAAALAKAIAQSKSLRFAGL